MKWEELPEDAKKHFIEWSNSKEYPGRFECFAAGYSYGKSFDKVKGNKARTDLPSPPQAST